MLSANSFTDINQSLRSSRRLWTGTAKPGSSMPGVRSGLLAQLGVAPFTVDRIPVLVTMYRRLSKVHVSRYLTLLDHVGQIHDHAKSGGCVLPIIYQAHCKPVTRTAPKGSSSFRGDSSAFSSTRTTSASSYGRLSSE